MGLFNANLTSNIIEIDEKKYYGNLKLKSFLTYETLPDIPASGVPFSHLNDLYWASGTTLYKLDTESNTWGFVTNLPYNSGNAGFCSYHNCIYMIGGGSNSKNMYKYDGETWTSLGIHVPNEGQVGSTDANFGTNGGSIVVYNDYIYMIGHANGSSTYNNCFRYNETTNLWSKIGTQPRSDRNTVVVHEGKMYYMSSSATSIYTSVNGSTWTQITEAPYSNGKIVSNNNKLYLCCITYRTLASNKYDYSISKKIYRYNGNEWVNEEDAPYELYGSSCISNNNKIFIFGGSYMYYTYQSSSATATSPYTYKVLCLKKITGYIKKG